MCIAINCDKGARITKEHFMNSWENNPDGFGMLWADQGKLLSWKTLTDPEKAYENYIRIADQVGDKSEMVLHFRIGTHGGKNMSNCHPFYVNENLAFVHNGMLDINIPEQHKGHSDTWMFNESILKKLPGPVSPQTQRSSGRYAYRKRAWPWRLF